jgi:hypothetical protein
MGSMNKINIASSLKMKFDFFVKDTDPGYSNCGTRKAWPVSVIFG